MLEPHSTPPSDARLSWIPPASNICEWNADTLQSVRATLATTPAHESASVRREPAEHLGEFPYRYQERIGTGGMGEVWSGVQESLGRTVAIKRIRHDRIVRADENKRRQMKHEFRNEALAAAALEHPNIAPVYDFGLDDMGDPMLAMKLVRGRPWDGLLIEDRRALTPEDFVARHLPILISMAQAVAYAHAHGIVHRDLKPSQVMVGEFGEALLMDWGLALRLGGQEGTAEFPAAARSISSLPTPETATNPAGTPALMAPEQTVLDAKGIGTHTDVFLLGGTLYYILTGYYPNESEDGASAVELARVCQAPRPEVRSPELNPPKELADLTMRAMARDPKDRVSSARDFVWGLQAFMSGEGRRRVAGERVDEARAALEGDADGYDGFSRALASLEEARRHWPGHPDIEPLRQDALARQAELALREGDLAFARLQAEALPLGGRRDLLLGEVDREQARRNRKATHLRLAGAAVVILALVVAGVSAAFAQTLQTKNKELAHQKAQVEEQRGIAEAKRDEAEHSRSVALAQYKGTGGLVAFMLNDLNSTLDMELPHDKKVAETVAEGLSKYYGGIDSKSLDDELLAEHASQLLAISKAYQELGLYEFGKETAEESRAIRTQLFGKDSVEVGEVLSIEGVLTGLLGRAEEGIEQLRQSVASMEGKIPEHDNRFVVALGNLGEALAAEGKAQEGVEHIRRVIAIREKTPGDLPLQMLSLKHNLAGTLINLNELDEAQQVLDEMEASILATVGADSVSMADLLYLRATLARMRGESAESILALLERAIAVSMTARGADHPITATLLNNAAIMKQRNGRLGEALQDFKNLYDLRHARFGDNHPETATTMNNIGNLYSEMGEIEEALEWLLRARDASIATSGPDHIDVAPMEGNIGLIYAEMGRFEEAIAPLEHGLAIRVSALGDRHPATMNSRVKLLLLHMYWARHEDKAASPGSSSHWATALAVMKDYIEESLHVAPVSAFVAECRLRTGDIEGATISAKAAAEVGYGANPNDPEQVAFAKVCEELGVVIAVPDSE